MLASPIATVPTTEGAAYGAALLASVGAGWHGTVAEAVAGVVATVVAEPGPDAATYEERQALHRELYPALAPLFPRMGAVRRGGPQAPRG